METHDLIALWIGRLTLYSIYIAFALFTILYIWDKFKVYGSPKK